MANTLVFVFAVVVLASVQAAPNQVCEPNSTFKQDCNTCRCLPSGEAFSCTRIKCPPTNRPQDAERTKRDSQECVPKSTFKRDCNTCVCSDDGKTASCTLMACLPSSASPNLRKKRDTNTPENCVPGSVFRDEDDCNTCHCSEDGKTAACTLKYCPKVTNTPDNCVPGAVFMDDCNRCTCGQDGKSAFCTLKACPPKGI